MKVLLISKMLPSLGGLETMGRIIALVWQADPAIELRVVTDTAGGDVEGVTAPLIRRPSLAKLYSHYDWADVVFFNHCYVRLALPLLLTRCPYVVSMSGIIEEGGDTLRKRITARFLKKLLQKADANIAACEAVRVENQVEAEVIVNPFDVSRYRATTPQADRTRDFLFAGRVTEIKGCLDMVRALALLAENHQLRPTISVAGDGDGRDRMLILARELGVEEQIDYLGRLDGDELQSAMNCHRCILVPSNYVEPIGIVCLEGISCGCVAIGSSAGGLGESVGPCGFTFPNGNVAELADRMRIVLTMSEREIEAMMELAPKHLEKYRPERVVTKYLDTCCRVVPKSPREKPTT